ncbi:MULTISPECIES: hypothetical protein [Streptomycetaceae]|uniref:hypothetical protein n=1 Tax=Streptomycetaceae TaxID=2062 RepID=UPI00300A4789
MEPSQEPAGPLSEEEFQQFLNMLRRYLHHDLDQWELLVTQSEYGPLYAVFANKLPEDWPEDVFRQF